MEIPRTSCQEIGRLLNDNKWHSIYPQLRCECPDCVGSLICLRVREDGRLLCMNEENAIDWYGGVSNLQSSLEKNTSPANNIGDISEVQARQISRKSKDQTPQNNDRDIINQTRTEATGFTNPRHQESRQDTRKPRLLPPCHCESCSSMFWFSEAEQSDGDVLISDRAQAVEDVRGWANNAIQKSNQIATRLRQHGKTLRKRWNKKFTSPKRQHVKILDTALVSLAKRGDWEDFSAGGKQYLGNQRHFGKDSRAGLLTFVLDRDKLIEDPDNLFHHLEARSNHPSKLFYSDFHCVSSVSTYNRMIQRSFIPGTFDVTVSEYGTWHEWEDVKVHSFQAVAASVSVLVFESQSETLDALWEIVDQLSYGLSSSANTPNVKDEDAQEVEVRRISRPALIDSSLYVQNPGSGYSLQDVHHLCSDYLDEAIIELTLLRESPKAFTERMKASVDFQKAAASCDFFVGYHVLVEPHERVLWWLFIAEEAQDLLEASMLQSQNEALAAKVLYLDKFKSLMATIRTRSDQLLRNILAYNLENAKPGSLVPNSVLGVWKDINTFLAQYVFADPLWKSRIINQTFYRNTLGPKIKDLLLLHSLIQEWSSEALLITRIQEVLMACEPTIMLHHIEPFSLEDSVRYKLFPPAISYPYEKIMRVRGTLFTKFFPNVKKTVEKPVSPELHGEVWENYQQASLYFYEQEGFQQEWLEKVEEVWSRTEPLHTTEFHKKPRRVLKKDGFKEESCFETQIPHMKGEQKVTHRKLTRKQREKLNPTLSEDELTLQPLVIEEAEPAEVEDARLQVFVSQASLIVAQAVFSNAQVNAQSIRWQSFCNFMRDAGCTITLPNGGGASTKFAWTDVRDGTERGLTLHRPHPVPILEPQMLRNACTAIKGAFGWEYECFVTRGNAS